MTKQEAIDIIKCLAWHTRPNEEDVEQAIKALEQEPCVTMRDLSDKELKHFAEEMKKVRPQVIEQEPRWIPTSERYPRPDDEYKFFLVTDDKGRVSVQEFYISLDEEPQLYFSGMVNVIAWMPLPEPYKAESEDFRRDLC